MKKQLVYIVILLSLPFLFYLTNKNFFQNDIVMEETINSHPLLFYDERLFLEAVNRSKPFISNSLSGATVPHHLVASDNIANIFATIQKSKPKTIVIIGPNHYEKGGFDVLTSRYGWETPTRIVRSDTERIDQLVEKNLAKVDESVFSNEHSIASLIPFISYYVPDTKIIPLIIKRDFDIDKSEILATYLSQFPPDTFFIASVDFSHYLPKEDAYKKDWYTKNILGKRNYQELFKLDNDYLDSPSSIIILMKIMEKRKTDTMNIFAHTNSADHPSSDQKSTTSHFAIGFY